MENKEKILGYLLKVGKENPYRIASALKITTGEVTETLDELSKEGKVEISSGVAKIIREPNKASEENIKEKVETLKEKQELALEKLKEAVKILEE